MQSSQAQLQVLARIVADRVAEPCVVASADEIRYAVELRERLRQIFPNRPARDVPVWSVGAD